MTISSRDYFRMISSHRPAEPSVLALIDRVACTSCRACATACPMECIYEVEGTGQSESGPYHAIDTTRCIGCRLCSQLVAPDGRPGARLCPRDAILMVPNPNVLAAPSPLRPYYRGATRTQCWPKIEEVGRQLYLAREIRTRRDSVEANRALACLAEPQWSAGGLRFPVVEPSAWDGPALLHRATRDGLEMLEMVFEGQAPGLK